VRALSVGRHILCLQEVHGTYHEVVACFASVLPGWKVFFSGFLSNDGSAAASTGGVLFLVSPDVLSNFEVSMNVTLHGRIHSLLMISGSKQIRIHNIHNTMISTREAEEFSAVLKANAQEDLEDPQNKATFVLGDFNYSAPGEKSRFLDKATQKESGQANTLTKWRIWEQGLSDFTEMAQPHPTHYYLPSMKLSRLDRCYTTLSKSLLIKLEVSATILEAPETCHYEELSDHSPMEFSFGCPVAKTPGTFAIP